MNLNHFDSLFHFPLSNSKLFINKFAYYSFINFHKSCVLIDDNESWALCEWRFNSTNTKRKDAGHQDGRACNKEERNFSNRNWWLFYAESESSDKPKALNHEDGTASNGWVERKRVFIRACARVFVCAHVCMRACAYVHVCVPRLDISRVGNSVKDNIL